MTMDEARRRSVEELTEKKKETEEHPRKGSVKAKENIQRSIRGWGKEGEKVFALMSLRKDLRNLAIFF